VRPAPSVLGRRFFESIKPLSAFIVEPQPFARGVYGDIFRTPEANPQEEVPIARVAIKRIHRTPSSAANSGTEFVQGQIAGVFFRELLCLMLCAHPAVLPVVGWNITPHDDGSAFFHITPYVERQIVTGERNQFGVLTNPTLDTANLDQTVRLKIAYGVARGMKHLHQMEIFHRDLKLDNIFYDDNGPRIADLGWSKPVRPGEDHSGRRGTPGYAAPEVLDDTNQYDLSADVYSYGICLWEWMSLRLWGSDLEAEYPDGMAEDSIRTKGLRPPLKGLNPASRALLNGCFGAETKPEMRYSFSEIVRLFENRPTDYFPRADISKFEEYRGMLDRAPSEPMDENLRFLLEQLTNIIRFGDELGTIPPGSPFLEKILFCLGRLFGLEHQPDGERGRRPVGEEQPNPEVILVARYQIATNGCLDGSEFVRELEAFRTFPTGRAAFPLEDFLIAPDQPVGANRRRTLIPIPNQTELFRVLRNILAGICCEHPCVLKVHGWNIVKRDDSFSVVIETDTADAFSIADFDTWTALDRSKFLLSAAMGVLELHCRHVFHNNLADDGSLQVKYGRAQICSFGTLDERASFHRDTFDFQALFDRSTAESPRLPPVFPDEVNSGVRESAFEGHIREVLKDETNEGPLRTFSREIKEEARPKSFPFDLFFHLVHSSELWGSRDDSLDVSSAFAELTRGLDEGSMDRFKASVNDQVSTNGFLRSGFFK
jgi:serine/threonine protein kinase